MPGKPPVVEFGAFRLHPEQRLLMRGGKPVALRPRAMDLLLRLAADAGSVVPNDVLMRAIWPDRIVDENNLWTQVTNLRQVLGYRRDGLAFVQNVPGRGYVLRGEPDPVVVTGQTRQQSLLTERPFRDLIGRDAAAAELHERMKTRRCLTIVGPAGIGKTALARRVAAEAASRFPGGTGFADLSDIRDHPHALEAIAAALPPPAGRLAATRRRRLLVLDGYDEGATGLAADLLGQSPDLSVLATSREARSRLDPSVHALEPLSVPPAQADAATAKHSDSVRLFAERASAIGEFVLDEEQAPIVASICRLVGGNPQAIELAAARLRTLSLPRLAATLAGRFNQAIPPGRILHAVIDWSCHLLTPPEQALLRILAGFPGVAGFTAIQARSGTSEHEAWVLLEQLGGLVDKALLIAEPGKERVFRLPRAVREFATEAR